VRSGMIAEFTSVEETVGAARSLRALGYDRLEAYTPFPVPELMAPLGIARTSIPIFVFIGGVTGALGALAIMWWTNAVDYPLNVGGRPLSSLPADVPIVFETAVLFAAIAAFALVFVLSGLPKLHDPIMDVEGFERTSLDRFWIGIDDVESAFNAELPARLTAMGAVALHVVGGDP
jgi:hypothetical protein